MLSLCVMLSFICSHESGREWITAWIYCSSVRLFTTAFNSRIIADIFLRCSWMESPHCILKVSNLNVSACSRVTMVPPEHCSLAQALPLSWSKSPRLPTRRGGTGSYSARYHSSCHPISLLGSSQEKQSLMPSLHSRIHGLGHCIHASIRKNNTHNHFCSIKLSQTWHLTQDIKSRHCYA
jgi:hypothetical protein